MRRILCPEIVARAAHRGLSQRQVVDACGVSQPAITIFSEINVAKEARKTILTKQEAE